MRNAGRKRLSSSAVDSSQFEPSPLVETTYAELYEHLRD